MPNPHVRTGRTRHIIHQRLFRKPLLVLQHAWYGFIPENTPCGIEGEYRKYWLDASVEDYLSEGGSDE